LEGGGRHKGYDGASSPNALALAGPLPPGRYVVQLAAPNDPPPGGRFAVDRVPRRNVDERVEAEFAICAHIDAVNRDLRTNDRVHVLQRYKGTTRSLIRRVETRGNSVLLYPVKAARGGKARPIDANSVALMGLVIGIYTQFRG
jgi:hypothetical protein